VGLKLVTEKLKICKGGSEKKKLEGSTGGSIPKGEGEEGMVESQDRAAQEERIKEKVTGILATCRAEGGV